MRSSVRELRVDAELSNLATIAGFCTRCCEQWHIDETNTFDIQLAVDEAATNIIEHGYEGEGGELLIRCWVRGHDLIIEILDHGRQFDPSQIEAPDLTSALEERTVGGLGMYFMQQLMDEVSYEFGEEGNRLRMVKRDIVP